MSNPRVSLTIPHASDLKLISIDIHEELGRPFEIKLVLHGTADDLTFTDMIGQTGVVKIDQVHADSRYFNGIVTLFEQSTTDGSNYTYHAVLRPWFWLLSRTYDCKIFQNQSVPDIFKAVCSNLGFTAYDDKGLTGSYQPREYCVQYRESSFQFLSRLLEEEGIYYYFKHDSEQHQLMLVDGSSSHSKWPTCPSLPFTPNDAATPQIRTWNVGAALQSGAFTLRDFDFTKPKADLTAKSNGSIAYTHSNLEVYDYPGRYLVAGDGETYARTRVDEAQAKYMVIQGASNSGEVATGWILTMTDHPRDDQNADYLIVSTDLHFVNPDQVSSYTQDCHFVAIPKSQTFRTPRTTPKPIISGLQTAIVTGQSGQEIWTDQYGRIKVQFHWDRLGKNDENSSCWMRVAQTWAGNKWGAQFIPRIGQEVVVEFLEGDPDRPLVTGSVYNADQSAPYDLPSNATQSGVKSRSSLKGDDTTFNELRFEDKKDSEQVYFHAEKDFQRVVENNDTLTVGLEKKDPGDQTITIHNNRTVTLNEGNDKLEVKQGNREVLIDQGNHSLTVSTGDRTETISKGKDTLTVSEGDHSITVSQGKHEMTVSQGNHTVTVSQGNQSLTVSQGNQNIQVSAGTSTLEAGQSITLKVGGNSIVIDSSGITIKGTMVSVQGQAKVDVKSPMTTVNGDGMLTLKGGMTQIN